MVGHSRDRRRREKARRYRINYRLVNICERSEGKSEKLNLHPLCPNEDSGAEETKRKRWARERERKLQTRMNSFI